MKRMADTSKVNWLGVIGLIGSILMIASVFLVWASANLTILGGTFSAEFSGMGVFSGDCTVTLLGETIEVSGAEFSYSYAPIVALAAGIVALITTIVPIVYKNPSVNKGLGVLSLILAIVTIALVALFYGDVGSESLDLGSYGSVYAGAGPGVWVALVGAVILAVGGIADIVVKREPAEQAES